MHLARYFFYVGGVFLALLFVLDAYFPKAPVAERANANLPVIRIHSERRWPERIVFDTSLPTIIPPRIADVSVKEREREAFASMQPSNAKRLEPSAPGRRELKPQRQRKIVKRQVMPRSLLVARQPQFGWFGNTIW
jgi:hypothetical protein